MPRLIGRLLLDTHVWIWLMEGAARELGPDTLEEIQKASERAMVLVSPISVWEVGMLEAKGRIRFAMEPAVWVRRGLAAPGLRLAELTPEVALASTRLPGPVHGDPADRMLIATARHLGATLVTRDDAILAYAAEGYLAAADARD